MDNSRKYTSLTIQQRIEILIKIQEGQSKKDILKEYKIAQSTLFKIEKNKAKLLNYLDNTESDKTIESKKRIRVSNYEKTSKLLYNWYLIKNTSGFNVKLSDFKLKALKINDKINGPKEFQCSNGWIDRFKEKYDIEIPVKKEEDRLTALVKMIDNKKKTISAFDVACSLQIVLKWNQLSDFASSTEISMIQELITRIKK